MDKLTANVASFPVIYDAWLQELLEEVGSTSAINSRVHKQIYYRLLHWNWTLLFSAHVSLPAEQTAGPIHMCT